MLLADKAEHVQAKQKVIVNDKDNTGLHLLQVT